MTLARGTGMRSITLAPLLVLVAGCAHWQQLRPVSSPGVAVGALHVSVYSARYAGAGQRLRMVLAIENRGGEPATFRTECLTVLGASGAGYGMPVSRPDVQWIAPGGSALVEAQFRGVPERDVGALSLWAGHTRIAALSTSYAE
jgi:hypothetical protein